MDLKIVLKKILSLLDLTKAQIYYMHKLTEIVIVCQKKDLIFTVLQVVMSSFKSLNISKEFTIVSFVISFYKDYFFGEKSHRMSLNNFRP